MNRSVRSVSRGGLRLEVFCKKLIPREAVERRKCPAG
jgi:hypothetical protein